MAESIRRQAIKEMGEFGPVLTLSVLNILSKLVHGYIAAL